MKRLLCFLTVVLLLSAAASVPAEAEGTYYGTMMVDHCKEWVSLRDGPGTGCKRIAKVPLFALVTDAEWTPICGDFIYCTYNGKTGYILAKYLEPWADPEAGDEAVFSSRLGFTFRYFTGFMTVDETSSESGQSLIVEAETEDLQPVYMEILTTAVTQMSPGAFLDKNAPADTEFQEEETENGASLIWFQKPYAENPDLLETYYAFEDGIHELTAIGIWPENEDSEWLESFTQLMRTLDFPEYLPLKAEWAKTSKNPVVLDKKGTYVTITASEPLSQIAILSLDLDGFSSDGFPVYSTEVVHELETLAEGEPLTLRLEFPGDMPPYGIRFTDASGTVRQYSIGISGFDGSLILEAF